MRRYLPFLIAFLVIGGTLLIALRKPPAPTPPPPTCVCYEKTDAMQAFKAENPPEPIMSPRLQRLAAEEKAAHSQ